MPILLTVVINKMAEDEFVGFAKDENGREHWEPQISDTAVGVFQKFENLVFESKGEYRILDGSFSNEELKRNNKKKVFSARMEVTHSVGSPSFGEDLENGWFDGIIVSFGNKTMEVSFEEGGKPIKYAGICENGHCVLKMVGQTQNVSTLHRAPGSNLLVGFWVEYHEGEKYQGYWKLELLEEIKIERGGV